MQDLDPYNAEVRRCFENPVHAGDLDGRYAVALSAEGRDAAQGAWLVIAAGIDEGNIAAMRFRALACPHLLAAAELACRDLEGEAGGALLTYSALGLRDRLALPVEKTGRLLLLEDVLRRLGRQFGDQPCEY